MTGSYYQITQTNLTEPDPNNRPGENFLLPLGEVRMRGVEIEATGELTTDISLVAGAAIQDSEITKNLRGQQGNEFFNVPRFQYSNYLRVDTGRWLIKGFSFGLGLIYTGERWGNTANNFKLPDYFRADLGLFYRRERMEFRVSFENLFDATYFIGSQNRPQNIAPGAPRAVNGGVRFYF